MRMIARTHYDSRVNLVLASASPRRLELLRAAGLSFETLVVDVDEAVRPGEEPEAYVRRLAMEKSAKAFADVGPPGGGPHVRPDVESGFSRTYPQAVVILAADTAVVVDGQILGKPLDDEDAARMLRRLSARRHQVMTGVSIRRNGIERGSVETTDVEFLPLGDADIAWYVATGEGRDKAGAYAIQGLASRFISRIEGSYSNVVGLPIHTVFRLLREMP